jgi:hypothetical protein
MRRLRTRRASARAECQFTSFFVASAGAGAALVGLLFVAISVNPGRNAGPSAPPERQAVAASAFTALINAFFFSLAALIAADSLGAIAITVSIFSIIARDQRQKLINGGVLVAVSIVSAVISGWIVWALTR